MFYQQLDKRLQDSALCVGLDPNPEKLSDLMKKTQVSLSDIQAYCIDVINATAQYVCAYKPQIAYFSAHGWESLLERLIQYIKVHYPQIPIILDGKRGDIGDTAVYYAKEAFERYEADALTVNPYMGMDTINAYLAYEDKGLFILCKTSNKGSDFIQNEILKNTQTPLFLKVAESVNKLNNPNVGLVMGATYSEELMTVQKMCSNQPILIPGVGHQQGDISAIFEQCSAKNVINISRGILYGKSDDSISSEAIEVRCQYYYDQIEFFRSKDTKKGS